MAATQGAAAITAAAAAGTRGAAADTGEGDGSRDFFLFFYSVGRSG